jgi:hypothetical protein
MVILALVVLLSGALAACCPRCPQGKLARHAAADLEKAPTFPAQDEAVIGTLKALHEQMRDNELHMSQGQFGRLADLFICLADPKPELSDLWDILQQAPRTAGGADWAYWASIATRAKLSFEVPEDGRQALLDRYFGGIGVSETHPSVASLKAATAFVARD